MFLRFFQNFVSIVFTFQILYKVHVIQKSSLNFFRLDFLTPFDRAPRALQNLVFRFFLNVCSRRKTLGTSGQRLIFCPKNRSRSRRKASYLWPILPCRGSENISIRRSFLSCIEWDNSQFYWMKFIFDHSLVQEKISVFQVNPTSLQ